MRCPRCDVETPEGRSSAASVAAHLRPAARSAVWTLRTGSPFCGQCATPLTAAPSMAAPSPAAIYPSLSGRENPHLQSRPGRRAQAGHRAVCRPQRLDGTHRRPRPRRRPAAPRPRLHRMMDAVHRFEGTVNQVLGDGIMALFGAPIAHEDHALRACYAALAMQAAMRAYTDEVRRTHGLELQHARGAQLRGSGGAGHWQRPAHGLLGRRGDHAPGGAHGTAGHAGQHPAHALRPCGWSRAWCRSPPWGRCR